MKIRSQFTMLFGLTSLVPLVLFGLFAFTRGALHLRDDAESALSVPCDRVATRVELWHEERLNDGVLLMGECVCSESRDVGPDADRVRA